MLRLFKQKSSFAAALTYSVLLLHAPLETAAAGFLSPGSFAPNSLAQRATDERVEQWLRFMEQNGGDFAGNDEETVALREAAAHSLAQREIEQIEAQNLGKRDTANAIRSLPAIDSDYKQGLEAQAAPVERDNSATISLVGVSEEDQVAIAEVLSRPEPEAPRDPAAPVPAVQYGGGSASDRPRRSRSRSPRPRPAGPPAEPPTQTCPICLDDKPIRSEFGVVCGGAHKVCKSCYDDFMRRAREPGNDIGCPVCRGPLLSDRFADPADVSDEADARPDLRRGQPFLPPFLQIDWDSLLFPGA
mmetsp:Transcript_16787/g.41567  ORF Transcript_16787/g.41567 Transcript_16787/m.41567 type:complete len:302 (+) Transcript_16787:238-1143(+)